jgi:hypothetical protein
VQLIGEGVVVELDAQTRLSGEIEVAVVDGEGLLAQRVNTSMPGDYLIISGK